MLEFGRSSCEECIDKSRIALVSLARQYVAGDHWLQNRGNRMAGDYSLMAIHAMKRRVDIEKPPLDIRGPFLRDDSGLEQEEIDLLLVKDSLTNSTLTPDHIALLRAIVQRRKQSFDTFLNKGKKYWDGEAAKAKPFLDRLVHFDPSEPQEKKQILKSAYWLDQGAFILAKSALGKCDGPWFRVCRYGERFQRFHLPFPRSDSY